MCPEACKEVEKERGEQQLSAITVPFISCRIEIRVKLAHGASKERGWREKQGSSDEMDFSLRLSSNPDSLLFSYLSIDFVISRLGLISFHTF